MQTDSLPFISVLVAARNEETNIGTCLDALLAQDYPKDKFEIWVGDDRSDDKTASVVGRYAEKHENVHLLTIDTCIKHHQGKSNVLAQLAHKAGGDYLFITDADMTVVPSWLSCMLTCFSGDTGIITGVTAVKGTSLFAKLQNAEWLFYAGHGHLSAQNGKPVTAMGNNMAVLTSAYWKTGGYENLPFSITEDYELFREIVKKGFKFRTVFESRALGFTNAQPDFSSLMKQRRRWFTGALQLPKPMVAGLTALLVFLPILILIGCLAGWKIAALVFLAKYIFDTGFLIKAYHNLKLRPDAGVWLYSPYSAICNTILFIMQLIPRPVEWKGRKYYKPYYAGEK